MELHREFHRTDILKMLEAGKNVVVELEEKILFIQKRGDDFWAWKGKLSHAFDDASFPIYLRKKSRHLITVEVILAMALDLNVKVVWYA